MLTDEYAVTAEDTSSSDIEKDLTDLASRLSKIHPTSSWEELLRIAKETLESLQKILETDRE